MCLKTSNLELHFGGIEKIKKIKKKLTPLENPIYYGPSVGYKRFDRLL